MWDARKNGELRREGGNGVIPVTINRDKSKPICFEVDR